MRALPKQFLKFSVVGVSATVIDFAVLIALTECAGLDPVLSAAVSFTVSVIYNYVGSMHFVYTRRDDLRRVTELGIFVVLSLVGLALNEALMWLGATALSMNYLLAKLVATLVVTLWNFFSRYRWLDATSSHQREKHA